MRHKARKQTSCESAVAAVRCALTHLYKQQRGDITYCKGRIRGCSKESPRHPNHVNFAWCDCCDCSKRCPKRDEAWGTYKTFSILAGCRVALEIKRRWWKVFSWGPGWHTLFAFTFPSQLEVSKPTKKQCFFSLFLVRRCRTWANKPRINSVYARRVNSLVLGCSLS